MRGIAVAFVLYSTAVGAQPLPEDKTEADRLFEEGRALLATGESAEACKKFDLSIRKNPRAVGTMLNVALCREEGGQVASASRFYAEARDRAHDQNLLEHKQAAERKLAMLAPRIPHVTITGVPADARVLVGDLVIAHDQLADVTLDPGAHVVVVTARGKLPYEARFEIKESERITIAVPALQGALVVVETGSRRALYGKILVGSGTAVVVGGLVLGLYARSAYWNQFPSASRDGQDARDLEHDCWTDNGLRKCNELGSSRLETTRVLAHVSTGAMIVGTTVLASGIALWLTAPDARVTDRDAVTLDLGVDRAGILVRGEF